MTEFEVKDRFQKDCDHDWQRVNVVLTSYPPKHLYRCSKCGTTKTVWPTYIASDEQSELEDLRLQLEESRALRKGLEAKLSLAEAKLKRLASHQKPLEAKIENQAHELARFNEIFAQLKWFKNPETGEYQYMSGPMMLKVIKRAEAKAEKWKQCALEAEDRAMGLTDELEDWKDRYDSTSAGLDAWHRKSLSLQKRFDDEEAAHERTTVQYERAMLKCAELTSEYNKLARHFVSLYNSLCVCCMNHNDSCCDCGSMERYKDIFEALEKGLNKLS